MAECDIAVDYGLLDRQIKVVWGHKGYPYGWGPEEKELADALMELCVQIYEQRPFPEAREEGEDHENE